MKANEIILRADSFKYPSSEEKVEALKGYPDIDIFHFKRSDLIDNLLNKNLPHNEAAREENLFWWNNCLINRFGKLTESYIYLTTNFNRKFPDDFSSISEQEAVNKVLFDYYSETFYYYFFSTRDVIAQILNIYCRIYEPENSFYFKDIIKKIKDSNIKKPLMKFEKAIKVASGFRNAFTHRFSPNIRDYRAVVKVAVENGKKVETLGIKSGEFISSKSIFDNINSSLNSLKILMQELNNIVK